MWLALFLFFLPSNLPTSADALPTDHFIETFEHYDFADGARTTAWWDRNNERLTLRQPDAGHARRWPALAAAESGGMTTVWVEDRGEGPVIWAQTLDRHGNRLWEEDQAITAWQGDWLDNPPNFHPIALSPAQAGDFWLLWGDETGVWASRWSFESGLAGPKIAISPDTSVDVTLRCLRNLCGAVWNNEGIYHLVLFDDDGTVTPLLTNAGPMQITWRDDGDLWVARRGVETTQLELYENETWLPVWDFPLLIDDDSEGPLDLAATNKDVWLLSGNPLQVAWLKQVESDQPPVREHSWQLAESAVMAQITTMSHKISVVWQTDDPLAFWARWISSTGNLWGDDARLLRLGLPDQSYVLSEITATSDGFTAVVWMENDQVYVRRWGGDGRSPWRHEVSPAYAPAPGWVVSEGLAHGLAVNQPWQGITAVTLDASIVLNGGTVDFYVSNQGPKVWQKVEPGQMVEFSDLGNELRWYARLRRSPWGTAPEIREVSLEYTYLWLQNLAISYRQYQK